MGNDEESIGSWLCFLDGEGLKLTSQVACQSFDPLANQGMLRVQPPSLAQWFDVG
jgi:hypothetical protein